MNMNPPTVTHQEKRVTVKNGKPIFFEDTNLKNARMVFMAQLARFRPAAPLEGAVQLLTKWCYLGQTKEPKYKTTKPDTDNMISSNNVEEQPLGRTRGTGEKTFPIEEY